MQFRQQALSKLQSPEELDLPVRFARPQGRLVLLVTVVVMAAACFWAVEGSVSSTVDAPAILTHAQGSYVLQSPVAGQITAVYAKEGQALAAQAPLLQVRTAQGDRTVRAIAPGRLTGLAATIGSVVATGANVASVERASGPDDPLVVMAYVPGDSGAEVPLGARVDLTVQSVPADRYGVLRGRVAAVGRAPQSSQQIAAFLGDARLAEQFSRQGRPVGVLVRLDRAPTTSGYRWSSADGPPFAVDSMTPATATVHLADRRPLDWLLP
ncbi:HlyD family efflux transporter periplasmic adaptor subunit [Streptomyces sp. NBC_00083]|uniref:HlyD family efflux transporter periplasmic adaptor subunit n=1 Tax=Streptomyces sp. NBC_00083 TaxID=2975647 RepID=UPI00225568D9|nr:HlyD family efflux transporter periplasmic adaptor subunit [Streptomyces sp. NBC_00083]MCX5383835.1 HlyD family efflux transporter periplasmic adaptor subunit [Streptomyces sp. NBC_00083]